MASASDPHTQAWPDLVAQVAQAAQSDPDQERRLRHWLADCRTRVLPIIEPKNRDARPTLIAERQFADGDTAALSPHHSLAWPMAAQRAVTAAVDCVGLVAWAASKDVENPSEWLVAHARATADEIAWQHDRLQAWLSDPEPEPLPLPELQTGTNKGD